MVIAIIAALMIIVSAGCNNSQFVGNEVANSNLFEVDFSILNSTKIHEMNLETGDTVNVVIVKESGRMDILVTDSAGTSIYQGDDVSSGEFELIIPAAGKYSFSVKGEDAKGSVSFTVAE